MSIDIEPKDKQKSEDQSELQKQESQKPEPQSKMRIPGEYKMKAPLADIPSVEDRINIDAKVQVFGNLST